ncbi:MAG: NAD(P)-dependent alcohol dehydrogenase [Anaerolineales bacterium]|nr:NAD(P)-dependent alcohol dehydrogenase [Anaerolineales bacterium]
MSSTTILGFAAKKPEAVLEPFRYELPDFKEHDVRIDITHCGVCYTDIQGIEDYYGITSFPFVPGHEIVGNVTAVGKEVRDLRIGDRVGVGWQGRSCMQCQWCLQGKEHLCDDIDHCATWDPYGGFSSSIIVDSRFAYLLPDGMPSEYAAVLMCAGVSVYSPLKRYAPAGGLKVGVFGVGGLGHLAIQFAHAMGNHVTALSSSPSKEKEALGFGADLFIPVIAESSLQEAWGSFDLLLYTSHGTADWTSLLNCLKTGGRIVVIGFSDDPVKFEPLELVVNQLSISGSLVGSRAVMREMLQFAQHHDITPAVELMPMSRVNDAIQKLKMNKARYRIVLVRD